MEHSSVLAVTLEDATAWPFYSPYFRRLWQVSESDGFGVSGGVTKSNISTKEDIIISCQFLIINHSFPTMLQDITEVKITEYPKRTVISIKEKDIIFKHTISLTS